MKRYALWLLIPFAVAAASDCGASVAVLAWIALGWIVSALVWLERYRRRAEQARQQRLNRMRRSAWEDDHAS